MWRSGCRRVGDTSRQFRKIELRVKPSAEYVLSRVMFARWSTSNSPQAPDASEAFHSMALSFHAWCKKERTPPATIRVSWPLAVGWSRTSACRARRTRTGHNWSHADHASFCPLRLESSCSEIGVQKDSLMRKVVNLLKKNSIHLYIYIYIYIPFIPIYNLNCTPSAGPKPGAFPFFRCSHGGFRHALPAEAFPAASPTCVRGWFHVRNAPCCGQPSGQLCKGQPWGRGPPNGWFVVTHSGKIPRNTWMMTGVFLVGESIDVPNSHWLVDFHKGG